MHENRIPGILHHFAVYLIRHQVFVVEFGRTYAYEEDYTIDEEAIPTLYDRISELQEAGRPVTVIDVKEIVDEAIRQSEKIGFRKLSMVLSKKRYDADDRVILYEKDFR